MRSTTKKSLSVKNRQEEAALEKKESIQTTVPAETVKEQSPENIKEETPEKSPKSKVKKTANKSEDKKASEPGKEADE